MWFRFKKLPLGARGEAAAARFLLRNGFKILDRNVRLDGCEIDIIAKEGDTIAFVEVKTRQNADVLPPEANVGPTKQRHIRRAAHRYIGQRRLENQYIRYDIVSVIMPEAGKPAIELTRNAFPDERR